MRVGKSLSGLLRTSAAPAAVLACDWLLIMAPGRSAGPREMVEMVVVVVSVGGE